MRATLSFTLPEERSEFELAQDAGKFQSVLYELDQQYLRHVTKYGATLEHVKDIKEELHNSYPSLLAPTDEQLDAVVHILFTKVRDKLHELTSDEGVDIL